MIIIKMNKNEMPPFMQQDNVQMLWDVLRDTEIYDAMPPGQRALFQQHVMENVRGFYNKEKHDTSQNLMSMNKKFIEAMLHSLKQTIPPPQATPAQKQAALHTAKHLQDDRQKKFERQLNKKKEEFDSAINIKVPPAPNFTDQMDTPISEMESLIAKTVAQRNFEMEQIHKMNASNPASQQFLSAQDTSLKNEKQRDNDNALKQIKISKEDIGQKYVEPSVIHLKAGTQAKRLTINEDLNETHYYNNSAISNNNNNNNNNNNVGDNVSLNDIFLKLKKIPAAPTVQEQFDAIKANLDEINARLDEFEREIKRLPK